MNDDRFSKNIEKINELYSRKPSKTIRELDRAISNIEENDDKGFLGDVDPGILARCLFGIAIVLLGFVNPSNFLPYLGGCIFFIAGVMIGLGVKAFGLIFLFSHGITGLIVLCATTLSGGDIESLFGLFNNPIMSDNPRYITIYLIAALLCAVFATISTILYNLSDELKRKKYSIYVPLVLYFLAILMVVIFPRIMDYLY